MKESQDFETKKDSAAPAAKEQAVASQETVIVVLKEAPEEVPVGEPPVAVNKGSVAMEKGDCCGVNQVEASKSLVSLQRSSA